MKIAILLPDLRPGGAERMRLQMANLWLSQGHQIEFVLCEKKGVLLESLPKGASIYSLRAPRLRSAISPLVRYLRTSEPDALLSAMWPLTVIAPLAARVARFPGRVVVSEHAPQSLSYRSRGAIHNALMRATMLVGYRLANGLVGVSSGVADDMARLSWMDRSAINVIHNPAATGRVVCAGYALPPALVGRDGPILLAVGNLKAVKRHDLLIRAFAKMPVSNATLCILGEGEERDGLEALIASLGLHGRVLLAGYQADPAPWYAHADVFVLSSDHEGFGNVIVEALEHGLPVVSTNCPTGPNEILEDGKYGTLVPVGDVHALAKAMETALCGEHDRAVLKARAQEFGVDKAATAYLDLVQPGWRSAVS